MKIAHAMVVFFGLAAASGAAVIGQVDNFEDGTTDGWLTALLGSPNPAPPINIATGGPKGAGDNYMQLTALGGANAGSRLTVINVGQWTGNYLSANIGAIAMDLKNFGTTDLDLRLLFESGGPPTDAAVSTNAFHLAAGSGWTHVVFPIGIGNLTAILGTTQNALSNTTALRLFHNPVTDFPGPSVVATLGVDNINAVPEPGVFGMVGAGLLLLARRLKR